MDDHGKIEDASLASPAPSSQSCTLPSFLRAIFAEPLGKPPRDVLRARFDALEAVSATLPGLPHALLQRFTSSPLASKNRYRLVLPLSEARVKLHRNDDADADDDDYINANYVRGSLCTRDGASNALYTLSSRRYIATQAPVPAAVPDFWRMCWEQGVSLVLMLVRVHPRKAECYWPGPEGVNFGGLLVTLLSEEPVDRGLWRRRFSLDCKCSGGTDDDDDDVKGWDHRELIHYQYEGWPDHGPPDSHGDFFRLHHRVSSDPEFARSPIVIHCRYLALYGLTHRHSAGVGRTGTFITIDTLVNMIQSGGPLLPATDEAEADWIMQVILEARRHRPWFVETEVGICLHLHNL